MYKAHGTAATWQWLQMIAPTVEILHKLAKQFNDVLGVDQGTKHAPAEISKDIQALMDNLKINGVYELTKGRVFDGEGQLATDVVEVGMHALLQGTRSPLKDYNESFERLQMRHRTRPVKIPRTEEAAGSSPSPSPPALSPPLVPVKVENANEGEIPSKKSRERESELAMEGSEDSDFEIESELELDEEGELKGNPLYKGDVGKGPGDEAAMPRRTEADVAFDMDVELEDDEGGAETDSDREVGEDDGWMTDEEV